MGHDPYFRWLASFFYAQGYDREDMLQEARLAAWLAPGNERIAARRRLIDIVKAETRQRVHVALHDDVPDSADVLDLVTARETLRRVVTAPLTDHERYAVGRAARGEPIARTDKWLENAYARARRKLAA